jgi:hypothetical protein
MYYVTLRQIILNKALLNSIQYLFFKFQSKIWKWQEHDLYSPVYTLTPLKTWSLIGY